jgi:molybdate transport system substrate-binding protein
MKRIKRYLILSFVLVLLSSIFSGCSNSSEVSDQNSEAELQGQSLFIYCGAGMTKPFTDITTAFKEATGCEVEVVYANAAQIQSQINTSGEGDLFIAGSSDELKPVQDSVAESVDLVKHIPVLAVQSGNPLDINNLNDLTKDDVEVVLGDGEATPIGKIANKALSDLGILDQINVVARAATAPEIFNALSVGECDAIIVWKENVTSSSGEIVETNDLDAYVKTVPAATLTSAQNKEALTEFLTYLNSDQAKQIWQNYGYEVLN